MMKKPKEIKGITLISLVITIIVLLILVGINLLTLTGENGLLNKAKIAKEKTDYATAKENLELILEDIKVQKITEEKRNTVVTDCDELNDVQSITNIEYIDTTNDKYALVTYGKYIFKIDDNLKI